MSKFGVRPEKEAALFARMERLGIREVDLEESFIRSSGPGGQSVNKSATCVQLRHIPTDTIVRAQKSRSQLLNRYYARKQLVERMEAQSSEIQSPRELAAEKARKQKARRRRRSRSSQ